MTLSGGGWVTLVGVEQDVIGRDRPERRGVREALRSWLGADKDRPAVAVVGLAAIVVGLSGVVATQVVRPVPGVGPVTTAGGLTDVGDPALRTRPAPEGAAAEADTEVGPPDLAVRPLGGTNRRTASGAAGMLQLEVRNSVVPLRLLSVTAVLPGVSFTTTMPANGTTLGTGGRVSLGLEYEIADCVELGDRGRLVLRVLRDGRWSDVVLSVRAEGAGVGAAEAPLPKPRQLVLDRVLGACS